MLTFYALSEKILGKITDEANSSEYYKASEIIDLFVIRMCGSRCTMK